jgi:outer membrane protein OmpA-like peptidoglycan-associated protein
MFTIGYSSGNDVPLEYTLANKRPAASDLKHKDQLQAGALLKFELVRDFGFGIGFEGRHDWMEANGQAGTRTRDRAWRPWVRATAAYRFDIGAQVTPFIGIEAAHALVRSTVNPSNHYRDYAINTGDFPLGALNDLYNSPESFTRGHLPVWEVSLVGGLRFGRHGARATYARPALQPAAQPDVKPDATAAVAEPAAEPSVPLTREGRIMRDGFIALTVQFELGSSTMTDADKKAVDRWVEEVWNNSEYSKVFHISQLRIIGSTDQRHEPAFSQLSEDRANALAQYLWDRFRLNVSKVRGHGSDRPISHGHTDADHVRNRYAMLLLDDSDPRNAGYRNNY